MLFRSVERDGMLDPSFDGGYLQVSWFLTGEYQPFSRKSGTLSRPKIRGPFRIGAEGGWGALQLAVRGSVLDLSDKDVRGGTERNLAYALNWWWSSHSRLQLGYVEGDIEDHAPVNGFTEGDYSAVSSRMMVDF